jgi:RNA polymerase sigma-70 factor (ECF subfamily)
MSGFPLTGFEMPEVDDGESSLENRALAGEEAALAALMACERPALERMIGLRLDPRLAPRVRIADLIDEAFREVRCRLPEFVSQHAGTMPLRLWFRRVVEEQLLIIHRDLLGTTADDATLAVSLQPGGWRRARSASLAAQLLGKITSTSRAAIRAEQRLAVQDVLNAMDPIDRENLVLRHLEHLPNADVAVILGLDPADSSQRYAHALIRLKQEISRIPGGILDAGKGPGGGGTHS